MTLREFLDEVRFGAAGTLCVAICGEEEYLDNFEAGMYWHLSAGNWHEGSESPAKPEIPEEIMEAEVTQVETAPDVARLFYNLSYSMCNSYHFTVVLVEEPADFDSEEYWLGKIHGRPITKSDWVLSINEERWDELYESCPDSQMALKTILNSSIKMFREYTEEDFSKMDAAQAQAYRKAQKLAQKIVTYDDLLVTFYMTSLGELFRKNWRF